jgi:hypothetical protein
LKKAMNTRRPSNSLRLLLLCVAGIGIAGCSTPNGGEMTWANTQAPPETKDEPGNVEATGGVDILQYRPPGSDVPENVRNGQSRPNRPTQPPQ